MSAIIQPSYADFEDYRYTQRIAVSIRWFLLVVWFGLHNYRPTLSVEHLLLNVMVLSLGVLNGYIHWRIRQGRPVTWRYVLGISLTDLALITIGLAVTSSFRNNFFVLYYPALVGFAVVANSWRLSFSIAGAVAVAYAAISILAGDGIDFAAGEERGLFIRVAAMFAVVAAGNLMTSVERERRREAVHAERAQAEINLKLQRVAQEAELAAQKERDRIAREIHDGIAQSIYALSLSLETCAELSEREQGPLRDRLQKLVPLAKQTLLETRHYIHDLKPLLAGERDLRAIAENHVKEFSMVSGIPVEFTSEGTQSPASVSMATAFYRILQESLANVLKHSRAGEVQVGVVFEPGYVSLRVSDNGVGVGTEDLRKGYGLDNMEQRAIESGGSFKFYSAPGEGFTVEVDLPLEDL